MKRIVLFLVICFNVYLFSNAQTSTGPNVYTCGNDVIETSFVSRQLNSQEVADMDYELFNPNGTYASLGMTTSDIVSSYTSYYNCHAYAWHLTEGNTNQVWINQWKTNNAANISKYWSGPDACFVECTEADAEKIFYYSGDHSAVKSTVAGKYESKWGAWYVLRHYPTQVPYTSPGNRRYYRRNNFSGPSLVPCTGTVTYSLPSSVTFSAITWNVGALQIVSGQGTRTITVQKSSSSTSGSATITATVTQSGSTIVLSKTVDIGVLSVTSISGNTTVYPGDPFTYTASPNITASQGDYVWTVTPKPGVTIVSNRNTCNITFPSIGTYTVDVRTTNSCVTGIVKTKTVSVTNAYYVSTDDSKLVTVTAANNAAARGVSGTITYTLYNQATGATMAKGVIPATGATLDFSRLPDGIYILSLDSGNGKPDTYRLSLN